MKETPADGAAELLWIFLAFLSFLLMLGGIAALILAGVVLIGDRNYSASALIACGGAVCIVISRVIVKADDKREAAKKRKEDEIRAAALSEIMAVDDDLGSLTFVYDSMEDELTLDKAQLPDFANGEGIDVLGDEIGDAVAVVMEALRRVYRDKDEIVSEIRRRYLEECFRQNIIETDGETVDKYYISRHLKFEKLYVYFEDDDGIYHCYLKADTDSSLLYDGLTAEFKLGSEGYNYLFDWY